MITTIGDEFGVIINPYNSQLDVFVGGTVNYLFKPDVMPETDDDITATFKVLPEDGLTVTIVREGTTHYKVTIVSTVEAQADQALVLTFNENVNLELPLRMVTTPVGYATVTLAKKSVEINQSVKLVHTVSTTLPEGSVLPSIYRISYTAVDKSVVNKFVTPVELVTIDLKSATVGSRTVQVTDMTGARLNDVSNETLTITREHIKTINYTTTPGIVNGETKKITVPVTPATLQAYSSDISVTATTTPADGLTVTYTGMVANELTFDVKPTKTGSFSFEINADGVKKTVTTSVTRKLITTINPPAVPDITVGSTYKLKVPVAPGDLQADAASVVATATTTPADGLTVTYTGMVGNELTFDVKPTKTGSFSFNISVDGMTKAVPIKVVRKLITAMNPPVVPDITVGSTYKLKVPVVPGDLQADAASVVATATTIPADNLTVTYTGMVANELTFDVKPTKTGSFSFSIAVDGVTKAIPVKVVRKTITAMNPPVVPDITVGSTYKLKVPVTPNDLQADAAAIIATATTTPADGLTVTYTGMVANELTFDVKPTKTGSFSFDITVDGITKAVSIKVIRPKATELTTIAPPTGENKKKFSIAIPVKPSLQTYSTDVTPTVSVDTTKVTVVYTGLVGDKLMFDVTPIKVGTHVATVTLDTVSTDVSIESTRPKITAINAGTYPDLVNDVKYRMSVPILPATGMKEYESIITATATVKPTDGLTVTYAGLLTEGNLSFDVTPTKVGTFTFDVALDGITKPVTIKVIRPTVTEITTSTAFRVVKGAPSMIKVAVLPANLQKYSADITPTITTKPEDKLNIANRGMVNNEPSFDVNADKIGTFSFDVTIDGIKKTMSIVVDKPPLVTATVNDVIYQLEDVTDKTIPVTVTPVDADNTIKSVAIVGDPLTGVNVEIAPNGISLLVKGVPDAEGSTTVEVVMNGNNVKTQFNIQFDKTAQKEIRGSETLTINGSESNDITGLYNVFLSDVKLGDVTTFVVTDPRIIKVGNKLSVNKSDWHAPFSTTAKVTSGVIEKLVTINYVPVQPISVSSNDAHINIRKDGTVNQSLIVAPTNYTESYVITQDTIDGQRLLTIAPDSTNNTIRIGGVVEGDTVIRFLKESDRTEIGKIDVTVTGTGMGSITFSNGTTVADMKAIIRAVVTPASAASSISLKDHPDVKVTSTSNDLANGEIRLGVVFSKEGIHTLTLVDSVTGVETNAIFFVGKTLLPNIKFETKAIIMDENSFTDIGVRLIGDYNITVSGMSAPTVERISEVDAHGHDQIRITSSVATNGVVIISNDRYAASIPYVVQKKKMQ